MEWITTETEKGKKKRHIDGAREYSNLLLCGANLVTLSVIEYDPTAPKCKNCLRVLKRLIEG